MRSTASPTGCIKLNKILNYALSLKFYLQLGKFLGYSLVPILILFHWSISFQEGLGVQTPWPLKPHEKRFTHGNKILMERDKTSNSLDVTGRTDSKLLSPQKNNQNARLSNPRKKSLQKGNQIPNNILSQRSNSITDTKIAHKQYLQQHSSDFSPES